MAIVLIGVGGLLGAVVRYELGQWIKSRSKTSFPYATLIINVTGAVLLGVVSGLGTGEKAYLLLGDGFLGAYTTFSTFMYEGFSMLGSNKKLNAAVYIAGSLVLGLLGFAAGLQMTRLLWA